jgi:hypothetical protein
LRRTRAVFKLSAKKLNSTNRKLTKKSRIWRTSARMKPLRVSRYPTAPEFEKNQLNSALMTLKMLE